MANIYIVNTLPVPSGYASVNRLLSYGKELVHLGNHIIVLSSGKSTDTEGTVDGVKYRNLGFKGLFGALTTILKIIKRDKPDFVILVSNNLLLIYPLYFVCKIAGVKLLQEKSEFPFVLLKKGLLGKLFAQFYVNTTYKLFDGLIVMTKPLMEYFKDKVRKDAKLFEMPMTVDVDRFKISKSSSKYGDYIAYCGNMAGNKDGVMNLIESFDIASKKVENVNLLLIGGSSDPLELEKIHNYAASLKNDHIKFFGQVGRSEIPQLLVNARALALARPSSLQSTGGFPTKLGEYLSTGNPVIVTKVGDIPKYLNESNAFIVEPDDNQVFADAIFRLFSNYEESLKIGTRGKEVASTVFNAKIQSKRLNEFLISIV